MIDNGGPGFAETGTWNNSGLGGYGGSSRCTGAGNGSSKATWQAGTLALGTYEVQVSWAAHANRAPDALYRISDGATLLQVLLIDQRRQPAGDTLNGTAFQSLGTFPVTTGTLRAVLANDASGVLSADAVRVRRMA